MLRPWTTHGGCLEHLFYLWNIYADVDVRYSDPSDITTMATGRLMMAEIVLDVIALVMHRRRSRHTLLTVFMTSAFVFWKTLLYLVMYINVPEGNRSYFADGTPAWKIAAVFWLPNGVWVVLPLAVMARLWNDLAVPVDVCAVPSTATDEESDSASSALVDSSGGSSDNELPSAAEEGKGKHNPSAAVRIPLPGMLTKTPFSQ
ncbi:Protein Y38H6C.16 [Aphelenchoides avenae]|nr:Protein Y38H6C.16 [Aphelenchus avenae]